MKRTPHIWYSVLMHFAVVCAIGCVGLPCRLRATLCINEFMADNDTIVADQDGQYSDWIELYNAGTTINLGGYYLTDDANNRVKWQLPDTNMLAGSYLLLFASGKDRSVAGAELHTNFKLSSAGEYLGLIASDGSTVVHEFSPAFPPQHPDISYGIEQNSDTVELIATGAACWAVVPVDDSMGTNWRSRVGFDTNSWRQGYTAIGYDVNPDFDHLIGLDLESAMYLSNATAYIRIPFTVAEPESIVSLTLHMMYDDGFIAYINGERVCDANPPASVAWNARAPNFHPESLATVFESFPISGIGRHLVAGENMLAIHGLNYTTSSSDFLIRPKLEANVLSGVTEIDPRYFVTPTPGSVNSGGVIDFVADTKFNIDRGFFTNDFYVSITSATVDAEIRFTTDGTDPSPTHGTVYAGSVHITGTTILRAAAFRSGWLPTDVDTHTYLFIEDVKRQSPHGETPGTAWPSAPVNGQVFDYGMDPDIVDSPEYSDLINEALMAIPSLSIVSPPGNLFSSSSGIYVNAGMDGSEWERASSLELLDPEMNGFQVGCGLRIRGGFSRSAANPKHSFRLFFREAYGDAKLEYPLFGDEGVDSYDSIDLRTAQNYAWSNDSWNDATKNTFVRDVFSRDCQRDLGNPYTRSRYYHLYLNGQYWGVYQTQERSEANYCASYFGGDRDEYDVVKVETSGEYHIAATDGSLATSTSLWQTARGGFSDNTAYFRVQGRTTDGLPDPLNPKLLDVDNLIDYMLVNYFTANFDAPLTLGENAPNNFFTIVNRTTPDGFKYFAHDSEHSMMDTYEDRTASVNTGYNFPDFNPRWLHLRLTDNAEYRLRFADRVHKHYFNNGALTPDNSIQRWMARADSISNAIIGESARWGDQHESTPYTRTDWQAAIKWVRTNFLVLRTGVTLQQYKNRGWYPVVEPPGFSVHGGVVSNGFLLAITGSDTVYYTYDGSDPRETGTGNVRGTQYTNAVPITQTGLVKARTRSGGVWSALTEALFIIDAPMTLRVTELMYHPAPPPTGSVYEAEDFEFIELCNVGFEPVSLVGVTFADGIRYTFGSDFPYIGTNECVVLVRNLSAFATRYDTNGINVADTYEGNLDNAGEKLAILDLLNTMIQTFSYRDTWYPTTDGGGYSLVIDDMYGATNMWDLAAGWHPSEVLHGTPGTISVVPEPGTGILFVIVTALMGMIHRLYGRKV